MSHDFGDPFRGQLQQSLVSYAQIVLLLDEMREEMKSDWKIKPVWSKNFAELKTT